MIDFLWKLGHLNIHDFSSQTIFRSLFFWVLSLVWLTAFAREAQSEILYLNNGERVVGQVISKSDDGIWVDTGHGVRTRYTNDEVAEITGERMTPGPSEKNSPTPLIGRGTGLLPPSRTIQQNFVFQFNPPVGLVFQKTSQKTTTVEANAGRSVQVGVSTSRVSVTGKIEQIFMTMSPVSTKITKNKVGVADPVLSALQYFVVTHELDNSGRLINVGGYDQLIARIKESVSPGEFQAIRTAFGRDLFEKRERNEWQKKVGHLIGRDVAVGDRWDSTEEYFLPDGAALTVGVTTQVVALDRCGRTPCLKLRFMYNFPATHDSPGKVEVTGHGIQFVDPRRMLIYGESGKKTVRFYEDSPGGRKVVKTITESNVDTFQYPRGIF